MIGLYYRECDTRSREYVNKLKELLTMRDIQFKDLVCDDEQVRLERNITLVIVFGGDGSVLRAVKYTDEKIPIVAINTGNVGFLTSYEACNLDLLVNDIINNRLVFKKRQFMSVIVDGNEFLALNDAVVAKNYMLDSASGCVRLDLAIDGQFVDSYLGDGLILSTPLGSTAYAISAGGPIMVPDVDAYVAAPICAHSLHSKPIVYSSRSVAKVSVHPLSKDCVLFVDGKLEASLQPNQVITVTASEKFASICDNSGKFFSRLSEKLNQWR